MSADHDWTIDPRPLPECLVEWQVALNGGKEYGARKVGQEALKIGSASTYAGILAGRPTPWEPTIRGYMTAIDALRRINL